MNVPADLKYTASHEWVRSEPDGTITTSITNHAQQALGDLVFIKFPQVGRTIKTDEAAQIAARCLKWDEATHFASCSSR